MLYRGNFVLNRCLRDTDTEYGYFVKKYNNILSLSEGGSLRGGPSWSLECPMLGHRGPSSLVSVVPYALSQDQGRIQDFAKGGAKGGADH